MRYKNKHVSKTTISFEKLFQVALNKHFFVYVFLWIYSKWAWQFIKRPIKHLTNSTKFKFYTANSCFVYKRLMSFLVSRQVWNIEKISFLENPTSNFIFKCKFWRMIFSTDKSLRNYKNNKAETAITISLMVILFKHFKIPRTIQIIQIAICNRVCFCSPSLFGIFLFILVLSGPIPQNL